MKVLILLSFINLPWIVNKRKNAWNSLLSVGDSRYIIDGNKKRIGSSYVIDKDQEKKRKKKGRKRNYTLKRLKYSLIYALKNFNRFSKLMNLNTHIYKHEIKHETSKSSFQRRSIGIYRFFFFRRYAPYSNERNGEWSKLISWQPDYHSWDFIIMIETFGRKENVHVMW